MAVADGYIPVLVDRITVFRSLSRVAFRVSKASRENNVGFVAGLYILNPQLRVS